MALSRSLLVSWARAVFAWFELGTRRRTVPNFFKDPGTTIKGTSLAVMSSPVFASVSVVLSESRGVLNGEWSERWSNISFASFCFAWERGAFLFVWSCEHKKIIHETVYFSLPESFRSNCNLFRLAFARTKSLIHSDLALSIGNLGNDESRALLLW
ncbi:hypothetical protein B0H19DRAFT_607612 [Mycena capillaripes]|nr:hypothetical protein B0H19DRAFT_607612 [Mycena capillaripes]